MTPKIEKLLYSKDEAAAVLGISPVTLCRLVQRGELKSQHIGTRVLFSRTELQRFVGVNA